MIKCPQCGFVPKNKKAPRATITCLRRITKDPNATPAQKLKACEFLSVIEGFFPGYTKPPGRPPLTRTEEPSPVEKPHPNFGPGSKDISMESELEPDLADLWEKANDPSTES